MWIWKMNLVDWSFVFGPIKKTQKYRSSGAVGIYLPYECCWQLLLEDLFSLQNFSWGYEELN